MVGTGTQGLTYSLGDKLLVSLIGKSPREELSFFGLCRDSSSEILIPVLVFSLKLSICF